MIQIKLKTKHTLYNLPSLDREMTVAVVYSPQTNSLFHIVLRIEMPYKELRELLGVNLNDAILLLYLCNRLMPNFLLGIM